MLSAIVVGLVGLMAAEPAGLDAARRLWQNGRYAEAQEAYEAIAKGPGELAPAVRASIALGRADCLVSQGEPDEAIEDLCKAVDEQPEQTDQDHTEHARLLVFLHVTRRTTPIGTPTRRETRIIRIQGNARSRRGGDVPGTGSFQSPHLGLKASRVVNPDL